MGVTIVNQDSVLERALALVDGARKRIWLTSPWITQRAVGLLLREVLPRVASDELDVRVVYRVKEPTDLEITDLDALKSLEDSGCVVRYSTRLHAKLLLVDSDAAIVSSSNLTATGGYGVEIPSEWKNEELGVLVEAENEALSDLTDQFEAIWDAATAIRADTVGITMDFPTVDRFAFVTIRGARRGQYITAGNADGSTTIGRIAELTAYNRSFPHMNEAMWITQGYAGATGQRGRVEIPDLQSLFSRPSKEHGFLVTKTFFEPESVFQIAQVEVLKHFRESRLVAPSVPVAPGADVSTASPELMSQLLGEGDIAVGTVEHHPEVPVSLRGDEIISKHLAVLGMTGSGKSNGLKVMLREFLRSESYPDLRVFVIDTHGEYVADASALGPVAGVVDVELRRSLLDEEVLRELLRPMRWDENVLFTLVEAAENLPEESTVSDLLDEGERAAGTATGQLATKLSRVVAAAREEAETLCVRPEEGARLVGPDGNATDLSAPGLYVLDLRTATDIDARAAKAAAVLQQVFESAKAGEASRALVVIDEAQHFAPEQQTGWLGRVRACADAVFTIASEGRKFGVGLIVSTQRPARVNKDVLSQCNSHMIFRVANVEDLQAIAGSFEAATKPLLAELPGFDTGVAVVGGTSIGMVTRLQVPLFMHT